LTLQMMRLTSKSQKTSPGNYSLGRVADGTFYVSYVGRSDSDLNDRLKDWVGEYKKFKFSYATSPKAAFEKKCQNYHDFGGAKSLIIKIIPRDQMARTGNVQFVIYLINCKGVNQI